MQLITFALLACVLAAGEIHCRTPYSILFENRVVSRRLRGFTV